MFGRKKHTGGKNALRNAFQFYIVEDVSGRKTQWDDTTVITHYIDKFDERPRSAVGPSFSSKSAAQSYMIKAGW